LNTHADIQLSIYNELALHIQTYFYHPDLEALRAVFAAVHAHYADADPVWLFVIGPPGSGKTTVAINCISCLPDVTVASDLTPRSFLVGKPGGREKSVLNRPSLILAFKDFTTMISKREEDQREIVATLREVYDGQTSRQTAEYKNCWDGKATVIAAVTPAIERAWSIHRDLGERFGQVRWENTRKPTEAARMARAQRGHEKVISGTMRDLTLALFENAPQQSAELPEDYGERIDSAATLIAKLRCHVIRDSSTNRPIIDVSPPEEPTRLAKSLATISCHHASLFGRSVVEVKDLQVAMRTALDTIPSSRLKVVQNVPGTTFVSTSDLREMSGSHRNTLLWQTDELEALGVLELGQTLDGTRSCRFTEEFADLWNVAKL
jgi:hypothetical protein